MAQLQPPPACEPAEPPEPPERCSPSLFSPSRFFRIGRDSRGHWVVQDQQGLCGGLFIGRAEAVKFALFENGHQPQALIMVPGILELDLSASPRREPTQGSTDSMPAAFARAA